MHRSHPRPSRGWSAFQARSCSKSGASQVAGRLRRLAAALAAVTCAVLASAVIVPAASARLLIPNDGGPAVPAPAVRVVAVGGMAGWQITVIAAGAVLIAALAAVVLDRARGRPQGSLSYRTHPSGLAVSTGGSRALACGLARAWGVAWGECHQPRP